MRKQTVINVPASFVKRVNINGMHGRVLILPQIGGKSKKRRNILMLYGHHSSIERMYSLALNLSEYGTVTVPDLPGFGGMDSFYKIGKKPTIDSMADYLATFIKLRFKGQPFTVCGISYGFLVATRAFQKYPELAKQARLVVSIVGFSHYNDFSLGWKQKFYAWVTGLFSFAPFSFFAKYIIFTPPIISLIYGIQSKTHAKMKDADGKELRRRIRFETYLWSCNDARTWFATTRNFLRVNLGGARIKKNLIHVKVSHDQYFNQKRVKASLEKIYRSVKVYSVDLENHMPTVVSDATEAGKMIPDELREALKRRA